MGPQDSKPPSTEPISIAAFYRFFEIDQPHEWADWTERQGRRASLLGTVLLAKEGINATVCGQPRAVDAFLHQLSRRIDRAQEDAEPLSIRKSSATSPPFSRWRVAVKPELVTFGQEKAAPGRGTGQHVGPAAWHALLDDPEVLVNDARNDYEITVGTFPGAVDPSTTEFSALAEVLEHATAKSPSRPIAMFCTGGIRCEKASSLLLANGHEQVYQLRGGILGYLEEVEATDSRWQGECFVFDQRVSVDQNLAPGGYTLCRACGWPVAETERTSPQYASGIACPHCYDSR